MRGTVTSLEGAITHSGGDNKYQARDELEPFVNSQLEWKVFLTDLRSNNWSSQFDACTALR